jgi:hypothetical protein
VTTCSAAFVMAAMRRASPAARSSSAQRSDSSVTRALKSGARHTARMNCSAWWKFE